MSTSSRSCLPICEKKITLSFNSNPAGWSIKRHERPHVKTVRADPSGDPKLHVKSGTTRPHSSRSNQSVNANPNFSAKNLPLSGFGTNALFPLTMATLQAFANTSASLLVMPLSRSSVLNEKDPGLLTSPARTFPQSNCISSVVMSSAVRKKREIQSLSGRDGPTSLSFSSSTAACRVMVLDIYLSFSLLKRNTGDRTLLQ